MVSHKNKEWQIAFFYFGGCAESDHGGLEQRMQIGIIILTVLKKC